VGCAPMFSVDKVQLGSDVFTSEPKSANIVDIVLKCIFWAFR
jgi:hypothetical protein